jgi:RNase P/RNase MRP subunit p29
MSNQVRDILRGDLTGLEAEIIKCTDDGKEGIRGKIEDETRDMLKIDGRWAEKDNCVFLIMISDDRKFEVDGSVISKRPEDRKEMRIPDKWEDPD